jgi:hypothetical protein
MRKKEAQFNTFFNKWIKNVYKETAVFELKIAKNDILSFDDVKVHQIEALYNAKHKTIVHKISDCGFQNPFDCFSITKSPAYVVVKYSDFFCLIDIDDFINERDVLSTRKSLTASRAKEIAKIIV